MHAVRSDIAALATAYADFKRVLLTVDDVQYTAVRLMPGTELGDEVHANNHQTTAVVFGSGEAVLAGARIPLAVGSVVAVPRDVRHNIRNTDDHADMHLVIIYSPPKYAVDTPPFRTHADHTRDEHKFAYRKSAI